MARAVSRYRHRLCLQGYGSFVRPDRVTAGNYPPAEDELDEGDTAPSGSAGSSTSATEAPAQAGAACGDASCVDNSHSASDGCCAAPVATVAPVAVLADRTSTTGAPAPPPAPATKAKISAVTRRRGADSEEDNDDEL